MIQILIDFFMKFGAWGLFFHSFVDAIIFPIPALFLQVPLSMLEPKSAIWLATVGYVACLLGTPFGYLIGKTWGKPILYKLLKKKWVDTASASFQKHGEIAVLIGSFTPIPFKVFTIMSGCMNFSLWRLIAYASLGRALKFYVVGILFYVYGRAAEGMAKDVSLYMMLGVIPIVVFIVLWKMSRKKKAAERSDDLQKDESQEGDSLESV